MLTADVMIFARIESLIAGLGLDDALSRAEIYLPARPTASSSTRKTAARGRFSISWPAYQALEQRLGIRKPLVLIPTAYNHLTGADLHARGASMVIHANHMVRAAFEAMQQTAKMLLDHDRSLEADAVCAPVTELFDAVGVDLGRAGRRHTTRRDAGHRDEQ